VNHPDLVALVGIWAYNAPAIAEVVEERKARDRITTVTFDAQAVAIEQMAAGQIDAMVVQNPFEMGIQTVRLLLAMHAGDEATIKEMFPRLGQPDGDIYTTGLRLIVPDADPLVKPADIQGSDHEYLPLSTFRAWLAKYGLSSS
jgi:ribose transport system substrate-binding protein